MQSAGNFVRVLSEELWLSEKGITRDFQKNAKIHI